MEKLPWGVCVGEGGFGYFCEPEKRCLRREKREDEGGMGEDGEGLKRAPESAWE